MKNLTTKRSEAAIQQECYMWFHNNHIELRGLLFHVNNNSLNGTQGLLHKMLGVVAGVSDLLFIYGGTVHCIEMKTPSGYQSDEQKIWEKQVKKQGVSYFIARSKDDFEKIINFIIKK